MKAGSIARFGLLTAIALLIGYVEYLIPLFPALPGIKLGLSNAVLLFALYFIDRRSAWILMLAKVALSGLLFSGLFSALYSLIGGALSMLAMVCAQRINGISVIGVSVCGALAHNIGQCLVACFLVNYQAVLPLLPILLFAAAVAGIITGIVAKLTLQAFHHSK
ncbi:MAG: Gx transporter family protein [Clostridia bacterium]